MLLCDNDLCRLCEEAAESPQHLVEDCPALNLERGELFTVWPSDAEKYERIHKKPFNLEDFWLENNFLKILRIIKLLSLPVVKNLFLYEPIDNG